MPEINKLEQRKQTSPQPLCQTSRNAKNPKLTKHLHTGLNQCLRWTDYSHGNSQDKNLSPTQPRASAAMRGLGSSSHTEISGCASERRTLGRGTSGSGTLGRLSPPADSLSSCWSTLTSKVFPAPSASHRVGAAGQSFCAVTSPTNSSPLRVWVTRFHGRWQGSGVCGHGAGAGGCGRGLCSRISCSSSGSTVGWSSTVVSISSANLYTISP